MKRTRIAIGHYLLCLLLLTISFPVLAQEEGAAPPPDETDKPAGAEADQPPPPPPEDAATAGNAAAPVVVAGDGTTVPTTTSLRGHTMATWKDIVVVPRKGFLKAGRVELMPIFNITMNDNLIQHYAVGGEVNYFLSDIFSIGLQGMYYFKNVLDQEFATRYHFGRVPSLNTYRYTAMLNFGYTPLYGKFTLFNQHIMFFEAFFTAGGGISGTEIIPRDYENEVFTNPVLFTFVPFGIGGRLFLNHWLAVQIAFRDYVMIDKYEPVPRGGAAGLQTAAEAKDKAEGKIVNNLMFTLGLGIYLPLDFKYTTFR